MSRKNVEVVRSAYGYLNRGDVEALAGLCADDFVMDMSERVFNPDTYNGPDGVRRFLEGVRDAWESYHWSVEETHAAGDAVVAMLHCEARSRESGPSVYWDVAWLWRFDGETPVSVRFYRERDRALEAVGLSE